MTFLAMFFLDGLCKSFPLGSPTPSTEPKPLPPWKVLWNAWTWMTEMWPIRLSMWCCFLSWGGWSLVPSSQDLPFWLSNSLGWIILKDWWHELWMICSSFRFSLSEALVLSLMVASQVGRKSLSQNGLCKSFPVGGWVRSARSFLESFCPQQCHRGAESRPWDSDDSGVQQWPCSCTHSRGAERWLWDSL